MAEKLRKVRKSRISTGAHSAVKRGRIHRFSKWCDNSFEIYWRTVYNKMRTHRMKPWEVEGITGCMDRYGFHGSPLDLWNKCRRNHFAEFMEGLGMSRRTLRKRFAADDWNTLELQGVKATYEWWLKNVELKEPD